MTALCNQPEAVTSDLGDDQSHYLLTRHHGSMTKTGPMSGTFKDNAGTQDQAFVDKARTKDCSFVLKDSQEPRPSTMSLPAALGSLLGR